MCKAPCWVLGEVLGVIRLTLVLGEELMISWGGGELMDKIGCGESVSYTHLTLPTIPFECRSRWSPYH